MIKWVYCGKPNCTKCPHGPYLYKSKRKGNKVETIYEGRLVRPEDRYLLRERTKRPYPTNRRNVG